jgi:hypothetical protein
MAWAGVGAENSAAFPEEGHEGPQSQPPCIESAGEAQGSLKRPEETFIPGSTAENHADGGGAVEEILQDHETGLLFENRNWLDLADKITSLLTHQETREKLVVRGHQAALDSFLMSRMTDKIERLLGAAEE